MDADGWNRRYAGKPELWGTEPNVSLAEAVVGLEAGRALDLACGDGRNARWLAGSGWAVTAVDFSAVAIDRARAAADEAGLTVDFQVHDLTEWVPEEAAFHLVAVVYLHVPHPQLRAILANAAAAVAPGGMLFVVGHHADNLEQGVGGPQNPDVLYTETDLAKWCELDVVSARKVERAVDTEAGPAAAVDALLIARH